MKVELNQEQINLLFALLMQERDKSQRSRISFDEKIKNFHSRRIEECDEILKLLTIQA